MYPPPWESARVEEAALIGKRRPRSAPLSRRKAQSGDDANRRKGTVSTFDNRRRGQARSYKEQQLQSSSSASSSSSLGIRLQQEQALSQQRRVKFREVGPFGTGLMRGRGRSNSAGSDSNNDHAVGVTGFTGTRKSRSGGGTSVAAAVFLDARNDRGTATDRRAAPRPNQTTLFGDVGPTQVPRSPTLAVRHRPFCVDPEGNAPVLEVPKQPPPVKRNINGLSPKQVVQRQQQRPGSPATHAFSTLTKTMRQRPTSATPSTRAPPIFAPPQARPGPLSPAEMKSAVSAAHGRSRAHLPSSLSGKLTHNRLMAHKQEAHMAEAASSDASSVAPSVADSLQFNWRRGSVAGMDIPLPVHTDRKKSTVRHHEVIAAVSPDMASPTTRKVAGSGMESPFRGSDRFDPEGLLRSIAGSHGYNAFSSNNRPVLLWPSSSNVNEDNAPQKQSIKENQHGSTTSGGIRRLGTSTISRQHALVEDLDGTIGTSSPNVNVDEGKTLPKSPEAAPEEGAAPDVLESTTRIFSPLRQPPWYSQLTGMAVSRFDIPESSAASLATDEDGPVDASVSIQSDLGSVASVDISDQANQPGESQRDGDALDEPPVEKESTSDVAAAPADGANGESNDEEAAPGDREAVHGGDFFSSLAITRQLSVQVQEYLGDDEKERADKLKKLTAHHIGQSHVHGDYVGEKGRLAFFDKCRESHDLSFALGHHDDDASVTWIEDEGRTPRSRFLRRILRSGELPLPVLNRTWENPHTINLEGQGIGDAIMLSLVAVLNELPSLAELNVADNMLTDSSLVPLMQALVDQDEHGIKSLNISSNDMDEACHHLESFLAEDDCSLKKLEMSNSDVDDIECAVFMKSLARNHTLTFLDLSHNEIGKMENRNHVEPSFVTGGEAIAQMLAANRTLHHLDLSWNYIMKDSAEELGITISSNFTLVSLCLAHNSFADLGSQRLAEAMKFNRVIKHLDLSYNEVSPRAALVMTDVLRHNNVLNVFMLDGNPLGRLGAEALMVGLSQASGSDVEIQLSVANCETHAEHPSLLDSLEPTGTYHLKLSLPYDDMVAKNLLGLANSKIGNEIASLKYRELGAATYKPVSLYRGPPPVQTKDDWEDTCNALLEYLFVRVRGLSTGSSGANQSVIPRLIPMRGAIEDYGSVNRGDQVVLRQGLQELNGLHACEGAVVEIAKLFNAKLRLKLKRHRMYNPHGNMDPEDDEGNAQGKGKVKGSKISQYEVLGWFEATEVTKPTLIDPEIKHMVKNILISLKMKSPDDGLLNDISIAMERRRQQPNFGLITEDDEWDDFGEVDLNGGQGGVDNASMDDNKNSVATRILRQVTTVQQSGLDHIKLWRGALVKRVRPGRYDLRPEQAKYVTTAESVMRAIFHTVFTRVDVDKSNQVDSVELYQCMQSLGVSASQRDVERTMSVYDIDGSGTFEIDEFTSCLMNEYLHKEPTPRGLLQDHHTHLPWRIPHDGDLIIEFEAEPVPTKNDDGISQDKGIEELVRNILRAKNDMERQELMERAISSEGMVLTAKHAQFMIDRCSHGLDIVTVVASILPQIANFTGRNEIFSANLDHYERFRARIKLGNCFGPLLGNGTGHYRLDLTTKNDRLALRKLAELNNMEKEMAQYDPIEEGDMTKDAEEPAPKRERCRDTSQKGNWSNFRNEQLNNSPIELTHDWFKDIPHAGALEFDYVSTRRPGKGATPLSEARFVQLAARLRLSELEYSRRHYRGRHTPVTAIESEFFHQRYHSHSQSRSNSKDHEAKEGGPQAVGGDAAVECYESDGESIVSDDESESSIGSDEDDDAHNHFMGGRNFDKNAVNSRGEHAPPACVHTKDAVHHWQNMEHTRAAKFNWYGRRFVLTREIHQHDKLGYVPEDEDQGGEVQDEEEHIYEGDEAPKTGGELQGGEVAPATSKPSTEKKKKKGKKRGKKAAEEEHKHEPTEKELAQVKATQVARVHDEVERWQHKLDETPHEISGGPNDLHKTHDDWHHKHHLSNHPPAAYKFVYYKLLELHSCTMTTYFTAAQAAKMVKMFPADDFCRVEAATMLFSRIFNVERFHEVLDEVSQIERVELFHRLGVMNCMSSYFPERMFQDLDLRAYENRQIAKVFVRLAVDEPGENMVKVAFRWSPEDPYIPGYAIPLNWQFDDGEDPENPGKAGIRQVGNLSIEYRTDYAAGCRPDWSTRRELASRFMHSRLGL